MIWRWREEPPGGTPGTFEEDRRISAQDVVSAGSLACRRCDAPVSIGPQRLSPVTPVSCPFCAHQAPLRDFLSLSSPTRPTRVVVRISRRP